MYIKEILVSVDFLPVCSWDYNVCAMNVQHFGGSATWSLCVLFVMGFDFYKVFVKGLMPTT